MSALRSDTAFVIVAATAMKAYWEMRIAIEGGKDKQHDEQEKVNS